MAEGGERERESIPARKGAEGGIPAEERERERREKMV